MQFYHRAMSLKDANGKANSVEQDETASGIVSCQAHSLIEMNPILLTSSGTVGGDL